MAKEKKSNEAKTSEKSKKPSKIAKWFKDLKIEMKKVVWPSKQTVVNNTSIVLATIVIASVFVGLLDWGFFSIMDFIYNH